MSLRWSIRAHDSQLIQSIEQASRISPVMAQILALRGITHPDQVSAFLNLKMIGLRPPEQLPGMPQAVEVIYAAIKANKKIFVYGDYDADGMTSTAILYRGIQLLGGDVSYFVPNRLDDGYGVSRESIDRLKKRGAELIVTVDCGISSVEDIRYAREDLGIQFVVTDHHTIGPELPCADAIVHPALPDGDYPFHGLCGAGVAFKLAWALCVRDHGKEKLPQNYREFLFYAISLAAIGTVCDVVPLLDENRIIVHNGLNCMRQFSNPGLAHLMQICKLATKDRLASEDLGFSIGPRLNAAGRLGQAQLGVELLTCTEQDRAVQLAEYIDQLNKSRDSLDRAMLKSANKLIEESFDPISDPALVLAQKDWHLGVIGIVAGRIAEKYHRPTIMLSIDPNGNRAAVGSCRSACGVNLYDALAGCQQHLVTFGGHPAAAGLRLEEKNIDAFREDFMTQVIDQVGREELVPDIDIDAEVLLPQLTMSTMNDIEKLAPFGQKNPRPKLCVCGVQLAAPAKTMGADKRHLSLTLEQHGETIRAVAFGKAEWADELEHGGGRLYDFAFKPVINNFRGRCSVEAHLIDFRPSESKVTA